MRWWTRSEGSTGTAGPRDKRCERMGVHTGGIIGGGDYLGLDVNRAARIAAVGWGGQVVISDALRGLVEHDLPEGVAIRSLGVHRLKDLSHPEHLFDLVIEGLPPSSRRSGASRFPSAYRPRSPRSWVGKTRSPGRGRSSPRTGSSR